MMNRMAVINGPRPSNVVSATQMTVLTIKNGMRVRARSVIASSGESRKMMPIEIAVITP